MFGERAMIGKAGVWGAGAASGVAALSVVALAGAWLALAPHRPAPVEALAPSSPTPKAVLLPAPLGPRADVARVLPDGEAVVAGRTDPGAEVALLDNGRVLLELKADAETGEFVFLPERFEPGDHNLALRGMGAGGEELENAVMAFTIKPPAANNVSVVAAPRPAANSVSVVTEPPPAASPVAIESHAPAESPLVKSKMATIARGDTLWRLSRERLGRGSLYRSIFQANADKLHDPNLIYPGQSLTIP
jgi:hypothetical protein